MVAFLIKVATLKAISITIIDIIINIARIIDRTSIIYSLLLDLA